VAAGGTLVWWCNLVLSGRISAALLVSGSRTMLKALLLTALLGWASSQDSQYMSPEEKTALR